MNFFWQENEKWITCGFQLGADLSRAVFSEVTSTLPFSFANPTRLFMFSAILNAMNNKKSTHPYNSPPFFFLIFPPPPRLSWMGDGCNVFFPLPILQSVCPLSPSLRLLLSLMPSVVSRCFPLWKLWQPWYLAHPVMPGGSGPPCSTNPTVLAYPSAWWNEIKEDLMAQSSSPHPEADCISQA